MEETWGESTVLNIADFFCMQVNMLAGCTLCGMLCGKIQVLFHATFAILN